MFYCTVNDQTELRLIEHQHAGQLLKLLDSNREHLRPWLPWVDLLRQQGDVAKAITVWLQQYANNRGFWAGIWFKGRFCGTINHVTVDWPNRSTILAYWLDAAHQGQGIMTACCRAMVLHGFNVWNLNRVGIECATENTRSRAIPERLGFKCEGILRKAEWLHDHFVDHVIYGFLCTDDISALNRQLPRAEVGAASGNHEPALCSPLMTADPLLKKPQ
jgi:ribosomal-protein-serine acetyltransferase